MLFGAAQGVRDAMGIRGFIWEQEWIARSQATATPWSRERLPELLTLARSALDD